MANEFRCSDCGKDGTRCGCHRKRPDKRPYQKTTKEIIEDKEAEVRSNLAKLRRMREGW